MVFEETAPLSLQDKLGLLRQEYPELKDTPDDTIISGLGQHYPATLSDPDLRKAYRLVEGRKQIESETPTEFLRADAQDFGPGPLGNVLRFLAPGGQAITRGAGQLVSGVESFRDMLSAAPRVYLGDNALTRGFELATRPQGVEELLREHANALAERPNYGSQSLREAWSDGGGSTPAYMVEKGLEQVPQIAASLAAGGSGAVAGLSPKLAAYCCSHISAGGGRCISGDQGCHWQRIPCHLGTGRPHQHRLGAGR